MKYITPVSPGEARGLVGEVYRQIKRDFGAVVDPFAVHSICPRLLAAVWSACRESELVGIVPRETKEAIAVAVSKVNQTPFCIDAHVIMLYALKRHCLAQAVLDNRLDRLPQETRAILDWATTGCSQPNGQFNSLSDKVAAEAIGTAVFFQYMNRIATVLFDDTPLPSSRRWLKPFLSRVAGWYFSFAARRPKTLGDSLPFLPDAPLPHDMGWAVASGPVAGAWARFAREVEQHAQAALRSETTTSVSLQLQQWNGNRTPVTRSTIETAVEQFPHEQRSAARLMLLTAIVPHEVAGPVVRQFADPAHEPEKLLVALSWASFAAARQIGSRLWAATSCHRALNAASIQPSAVGA